jgi:CDP-glycerol glycerophosphotransferase (TagB/SpsB family)
LFAESNIHKEYSIKTAKNKGQNVVVTGFPGTDKFLDTNYQPKNVWKTGSEEKKRLIWAPHHTIDDNKAFISFSSFLVYFDFMIELAIKYKDKIHITFKPHPILKPKLYQNKDWGQTKTDEYYEQWTQLDNGQIAEGEYIDLFLTSDALIHDSGSFLIEYLYTLKPVLRTDRDSFITDRLNSFGKMAFDQHYHAKNKEEVEAFIVDIINDVDTLKEERIFFKKKWLLPPNGNPASKNILLDLENSLKKP